MTCRALYFACLFVWFVSSSKEWCICKFTFYSFFSDEASWEPSGSTDTCSKMRRARERERPHTRLSDRIDCTSKVWRSSSSLKTTTRWTDSTWGGIVYGFCYLKKTNVRSCSKHRCPPGMCHQNRSPSWRQSVQARCPPWRSGASVSKWSGTGLSGLWWMEIGDVGFCSSRS